MSFEKVKHYFEKEGLGERVLEFAQSSATVEEAAQAAGCEEARIAKTLSFLLGEETLLIVTAGDRKIDNKKFKAFFHQKARMIPRDLVEERTGHQPGGVCPFATAPGVTVYLDESLKRFDTVYPAAGSGNSAVRLTPEELERYSHSCGWIDVYKE